MRFQSGVQIVLIVVSVIIITTVVRPKFAEIQQMQQENASYVSAISKASQFNARLQELLVRVNSFPQRSIAALNIYLPAEIDGVAVARDIENIFNGSQMLVESIEFEEGQLLTGGADGTSIYDPALAGPGTGPFSNQAAQSGDLLDPAAFPGVIGQTLESEAASAVITHEFTVSVSGTYESMKLALRDLERNVYPLHVSALEFIAEDGSPLLTYDITLVTYTLSDEVE